MIVRFKAHFDGRVIIPDEPVDLPVNVTFELEIFAEPREEIDIEERLRRLERASGTLPGGVPSDDSLRRENMYDERM